MVYEFMFLTYQVSFADWVLIQNFSILSCMTAPLWNFGFLCEKISACTCWRKRTCLCVAKI